MSVFLLELPRGLDETMCGKRLRGGSWRILPQCQLLAAGGMSVTVLSTSQGMALRHRGNKWPAEVVQLDSTCPRLGSPKADLEVRIAGLKQGSYPGGGGGRGAGWEGVEKARQGPGTGATSGQDLQWAGSFWCLGWGGTPECQSGLRVSLSEVGNLHLSCSCSSRQFGQGHPGVTQTSRHFQQRSHLGKVAPAAPRQSAERVTGACSWKQRHPH